MRKLSVEGPRYPQCVTCDGLSASPKVVTFAYSGNKEEIIRLCEKCLTKMLETLKQ